MSYDNHDKDDPQRVRYAKAEVKPTEEDLKKGKAIKTYVSAQTMTLRDFMKWYQENH